MWLADFKGFYDNMPKSTLAQRRLLERGGDAESEGASFEQEREESLLEKSLTACSIDINLKKKNLPGIIPNVPLADLRNVHDVVETYRDREFEIIFNLG